MIKKSLVVVSILLFVIHLSYGQDYYKNTVPQRIILNLTSAPSTSMAVTWRTIAAVPNPQIQVAAAEAWTKFTANAKSIPANMENISLDLLNDGAKAVYYSGVMDGLKPNTLYVYRVGGGSDWSEWNQFTTAQDKHAPFQFVFLGDAQDDIKQHVSRLFREAFKKAPDASFWLFAGDLTVDPDDDLLEELYYAAGFIFRMTPIVLAPGNHDLKFKVDNGKYVLNKKGWREKTKEVSPFWRTQFTLPENGIAGMEESSYYLDYQGVRIIVLNSNDKLKEQAQWMETILAGNPNTWTIVSFHHPLYSIGGKRDEQETRNAFLPLFDKYKVDLVLTGHDHTYARSYPLTNGKRANDGEPGTVYVVSVSGPKQYPASSHHEAIMAKIGTQVQLFQVISLEGGNLSYKAYTVTGSLYDSFAWSKPEKITK